MAKRITTVLGDIRPEELGVTTMHEHVMMDGGWVLRERLKAEGRSLPKDVRYSEDDPVTLENIGLISRKFTTNWDALSFEDEEMMLGEAEDFMQSGGTGLLELSVPGIRHKVPAIKRIAEKTGLHIIISTGLYTGDSWPKKYQAMDQAAIRQYMLDEIEHGVEDTGIKPGHLKIAIHDLWENEERALRAAAQVANISGLSLTIHTGAVVGGDGRQVARILKEEGMDLSRAVIAHCSSKFGVTDMKLLALYPEMNKLNLDYSMDLLETGINVSYEFYNSPGNPDWLTFAGIIALLKRGYAGQIVLGTDTCAKVHARRGGGEGYCRLTRFAIPSMREFGVSDHDIRMMMVKNPARILAY